MRLFHGSNMSIEEIDLAKCNLYKDFGQAFYLTDDREHALVVANARVSLFGGEPVVNEYEFDESKLTDGSLQFCCFEGYTEDWADFIFKHRDDSIVPPYMHDFDVVYGPIANDRVGMQIRNYRIGNIDKAEFMRRLEYMKGITFQWAFCTRQAIDCLKRV